MSGANTGRPRATDAPGRHHAPPPSPAGEQRISAPRRGADDRIGPPPHGRRYPPRPAEDPPTAPHSRLHRPGASHRGDGSPAGPPVDDDLPGDGTAARLIAEARDPGRVVRTQPRSRDGGPPARPGSPGNPGPAANPGRPGNPGTSALRPVQATGARPPVGGARPVPPPPAGPPPRGRRPGPPPTNGPIGPPPTTGRPGRHPLDGTTGQRPPDGTTGQRPPDSGLTRRRSVNGTGVQRPAAATGTVGAPVTGVPGPGPGTGRPGAAGPGAAPTETVSATGTARAGATPTGTGATRTAATPAGPSRTGTTPNRPTRPAATPTGTGATRTGATRTEVARTGALKAGTGETRAAKRRAAQPPPRGLHRWLEPAAYAALGAAAVARTTEYWKARRQRMAHLTRAQRLWVNARVVGLFGLAAFVVAPALVFALGYVFFSIPTPDEAVSKQVATISFANKSELAKIVPEEGNRTKVTIDQVPKPVQYAVLAAEDRSFFSNPGFDPIGIARAVFKQLTGGVGGGSTITQQYVKKTLVGDERSLWRKYKEMVLAVKISQQNRKDEILTNYLNAIYFGRGAYGIQSASQAYFGKNVQDLSASEGALLAGVIQSPSRWDPAVSPERAVQRWTFVMDGMLSQGWITPEERAQARFPNTTPKPKSSRGNSSDYRGLILNAIRDELEQKGISEQEFNQEGLRITTTIDPDAQQQAVDSARKALIGQPPNLRGALVSIDPDTGGILAYYGGDNGAGLDYARVSKQPGSTFKPFVLLAALQQSDPIGLGTKFKGMPFPGLRNSEGADCQVCDLKQATTISNNVIFHELALRIGPQKVADAAKQAGITSPLTDVTEGIALGNKEVTPVELASAYATIAAGGVYHPPHLVTKVTTSDDRVIYEAVAPEERRFSSQIARNVTEAMLGVPVADKLSLNGGRVSAAKTGTVQSRFEGENNDAWIAGFTPSVATSVWIGTDQNTPIRTSQGKQITGASLPGTIWKNFMNDAVKGRADRSFGPFKPIGPPPAAIGPADGFSVGPAVPATPPPSLDPLAPGDFDTRDLQQSPDEEGQQPPTHRECGVDGCRTVQDHGTAAGDGTVPDEAEGPADGTPRAAPSAPGTPDPVSGLPQNRQPVRG